MVTPLKTVYEDKRSPPKARHWTLSVSPVSLLHTRARAYTQAGLTPFVEEAFTSENWIVRIYAVKREDSLGRDHQAVSAFDGGRKLKKSPSFADASASASGKTKGRPSM